LLEELVTSPRFFLTVAGTTAIFLGACELDDETPAKPGETQFVELQKCELESGAAIEDCRIAYRTFGTLNAAKDNVVVWPTWFTGTTADLVNLGVPAKFVDTSRFFLVLVDALGDGVSTSPSNSKSQHGRAFPMFNVRDMVNSQHRLLEKLGIHHVHAIAGISMGGMQAMQWSVSYPDFMDTVISVVGTPKLAAPDIALWTKMLASMEANPAFAHGNYASNPDLPATDKILTDALFTPEYRAPEPEPVPAGEPSTGGVTLVKGSAELLKPAHFDWNDEYYQLHAMLQHDVSVPWGSLEAAAGRIHAKSTYLNSGRDQIVNPEPVVAFGKFVKGATVEVNDSVCGHLEVQVCGTDAAAKTISALLFAP
jgi:homoserine O-acetyltransferase